jgi:dTDP-L-rhamnose 4-epimerase
MASVLVTGGAGFIGSHLCPKLVRAGHEVRILDSLSPQIHGQLDRPPEWTTALGIEFVRGSVTSPEHVERCLSKIDAVVHLAAETGTGQSMYQIARYNEVNAQGTAALLDVIANASRPTVKRVLLASSRSVYGEGAYECRVCDSGSRQFPRSRTSEALAMGKWEPECELCSSPLQSVPTRESDPPQPGSIYAATKLAQEALISVSCEALGIPYGLLRLQNVYGEGQSLQNPYTGILSIFSTRLRGDSFLPIFEDGQETRDFIHVSDVATAFARALTIDSPLDCIVNVGTGDGTTVEEVAVCLSQAFDRTPHVVVTGEYRLGDIRHNSADVDRMHELLGCRAQIGLDEGLRRFVDWVKTQPLPVDRLDHANRELKARNLMG